MLICHRNSGILKKTTKSNTFGFRITIAILSSSRLSLGLKLMIHTHLLEKAFDGFVVLQVFVEAGFGLVQRRAVVAEQNGVTHDVLRAPSELVVHQAEYDFLRHRTLACSLCIRTTDVLAKCHRTLTCFLCIRTINMFVICQGT